MLLACFSIPILHIIFIHITKKYGESALPLIAACAVSLIGWCCVFLYALVLNLLEVDEMLLVHLSSSFFIYVGFIFGYLEFFSLINRGYSLSIMMDVSRRLSPPTAAELEQEYAGGKGLR